MSTSQRISDNKTHRHLQAISMLLGHRGKTPPIIKQRNKSPISVIHNKTPRLNNILKYQQFFSSLLKTYQINKLRHKQDFFSRLKLQSQQHHYPKYQVSTPVQPKRPQNQKYNRKIKSIQTIQEFIEISTNKLLEQAFQTLKHYIPDQTRNVLRVNKTHRKTYSQIYTDLIHNGRSKSPSTIYKYEYRTPEVRKEVSHELKTNEVRILVLLSEKIVSKKISSAFSQLKSHSASFLMVQLQQLKRNYYLDTHGVEQINRQISTLGRKNKLMEKQLQQSEQKLKKFTQKVNQLQNEVIITTKNQQNVKKQSQALRRLLEATKRQFETRNKQLESVKKELLLQKAINEKNLKQSTILRRQFEATQKQCESTKKQLAKKSEELSSINEQFKLSKEKFQNKLRAIQKGPNPLESMMMDLQSQKRELQNEMTKQKNLKKQLERKLMRVEKQLQTARNSILSIEETGKSNTQIIKSQQKQLSTVKKQLETTKKELDNTHKELEILRKERLLAQNQLQSIRKKQLKRQQELQSIKRQLSYKERQIDMKEKSLLPRQQQLNQMQIELSNQQKQLESSKKQFDLKLKSESKNSKGKANQSAVLIDMDSRDSELQSLKKQLLLSKQQCYQATNSLLVSQKLLNQEKQKTFLLSQKQQQKQKELLLHDQYKKAQLLNLQRKVAALIIYQILATKFNSRTFKLFQALSQIQIIKSSIHSNCLFMERVINDLLKDRKKTFFKRSSQTPVKHNSEKEIEFVEKSLTSQIKIKSIYSSKQSLSNASIISNNFDLLAKKINKAFQLKNTLHEIYQYCFQKIDYAALLYLGISNPLNKLIHKNMMEGFRKILFFSFSKNQQSRNKIQFEDTQILKRGQRILSFLKKVDNKIVFSKIQAYCLLKINAELKKSGKIRDESIISQSQLKRELNDFLQQRNRVYEKTFETWERTKQMISDYKLVSSQRSY